MSDPAADPSRGPVDLLRGEGVGPVWGIAAEDVNVTLLAWPPHEGVPAHVNDELDVIVVVVDGAGTCTVDGSEETLRAPAVRLIPKGAERAIAAGPEGMRYLSIHRRRGLLQIG